MGFSAPDVVGAAISDRVVAANEVEVGSRNRRHTQMNEAATEYPGGTAWEKGEP